MKRRTLGVRANAASRLATRKASAHPGRIERGCPVCGVSPHALRRLARRLGVDADVVHRALHAMPMSRAEAVIRVNRVASGLERELGGKTLLRKWVHTPIRAFDNRKPVELLVEGRVEPLERLHAVLETGVYS